VRGAPMTDPDRYFAGDESAHATGGGTFVAWDQLRPIELVRGLEFQPVVGENVMVNFVRLAPHTEAPLHWHDEEQISFVVDGELEFEVDGEKRMVRRGEAIVIPPNVPHAARTQEGACLEVDVFHPPRRALLEAKGRAEATRTHATSQPGTR
jgi:quercetin dioxygenase-like cupin family protein